MHNEHILRLFSRIRMSGDGQEFIDYLKELSRENYQAFKKDSQASNDIHKGYAIAIDSLLQVFDNCNDELRKSEELKKQLEQPDNTHY